MGASEEGRAFSEEWLIPGPGRICLAEPQLLFAAQPGREADSDSGSAGPALAFAASGEAVLRREGNPSVGALGDLGLRVACSAEWAHEKTSLEMKVKVALKVGRPDCCKVEKTLLEVLIMMSLSVKDLTGKAGKVYQRRPQRQVSVDTAKDIY